MTIESRQTRAIENGPEVVCLCGGTRFYDEFQRANYRLTMAGKIVLTVGFYPHNAQVHGEGVGATSDEKVALDELHKRKIDLAHRVFVLNVDGYIGDSTRGEIAYAERHGVPVEYLEPVAAHDFEITEDADRRADRVGWACGTCNWGGLGLPSEEAARREHAGIAADIAAGRLESGDAVAT